MEKLIAYLGDEKVKDKYLNRVKAHYEHDEIEKGYYWENGKGCAVGCTIEGSDHSKYETELGIPRAIARVEDRIFEGMSNEKAKEFPVKFLEAVNVGADLSLVLPKFYVRIFTDPDKGTIRLARKDGKIAIEKVVSLFEELIKGNPVTQEEWIKARADAAADAARTKHFDWMAEVLLGILRETK